jgi:hypothetical protein
LLHDQGADVSVVTRRTDIVFHARPTRRTLWRRMVRPSSGIGGGWRLRVFSDAPWVFHALPPALRQHWARSLLGPSTGWFMKDRIVGKVPLVCGFTPQSAASQGTRVQLAGKSRDGRHWDIVADHLIAATGYRVDVRRLGFMADELRAQLRTMQHTPVLSSGFETSVPGLHIIGPASMFSFGPLVRFVHGDKYTARRIVKHLAKSQVRQTFPAQLPVAG